MKRLEIVIEHEKIEALLRTAREKKIEPVWVASGEESGMGSVSMLVENAESQKVIDAFYGMLGPQGRIVLSDPEAVLPLPDRQDDQGQKVAREVATREELFEEVEKGARLGPQYFLLVGLSTLVAAIGLLRDNVAVVIGAMVIAPLLGPNLALALGTALGDGELTSKAITTSLAGIAAAALLSLVIGGLWPGSVETAEILARTDIGLDSVVLALASGAAAALSLTSGLSSTLVGVMVAVALLPPLAASGLLAGQGRLQPAGGALLLLLVNVVCVNLAANLVFLRKGIRPRTWLQRKKASQSMRLSLLVWLLSLLALVTAILARKM